VERLVLKSRGEVLFLHVTDIDWVDAAGCYACLHVGCDTHVMRRTLLELGQDLGEENFIRIHRSIIVNLDRIRGIELQEGGDYEVVLKSKVRLRVSTPVDRNSLSPGYESPRRLDPWSLSIANLRRSDMTASQSHNHSR
jgi:DNA-binding LytR/AlgR family response regulator